MKIKRAILLAALNAVQPGIATKETVSQSSSFVFDNDRVYSYNDEISVSVPLALGITGSVPAKEFAALVGKFKGEDVTITVEGNELHVVVGKSQAGLRMEDEIKLPLEELGMPDEWIELPKSFGEAVKACLFSAGKDQTKYILTHIHINGDCVESSDGYRATQYLMEAGSEKSFPESLLIPFNAAKNITSYKAVEYALTPGWIHFRNEDDMMFSCRWPEGEVYPDVSVFINATGEKIELPAGLAETMERGAVLADGARLTIILEGNGKLILATENDAGWFEEETDIAYKGKALEFDTYPEFLSSILKIKAEVSVSDKLMKFETDNMIHVVALLPSKAKK